MEPFVDVYSVKEWDDKTRGDGGEAGFLFVREGEIRVRD
jgi:hypothetical protein